MGGLTGMPKVGERLRLINTYGWDGKYVGELFKVIAVTNRYITVQSESTFDMAVIAKDFVSDFELVSKGER